MAILKTMPEKSSHGDRTLNRVFPVTVKLTKEELVRVTDFSSSQGLARGNGYAVSFSEKQEECQ